MPKQCTYDSDASDLDGGHPGDANASRGRSPRYRVLLVALLIVAGIASVTTSGIATEEISDQAFYLVAANQTSELESSKRLAYVFYVTTNEYACAALQFMFRLVNQVGMDTRRIDIAVLYTKNVKYTFIKKIKNTMHARTIRVDVIQAEASDPMWENSLTKLRVFQDWGYERIVFLDSDAVPLTNLDHLFDLPSAILYAPTAYWLSQPFFASTLMVIEPSNEVFNELMDWVHARGMSDEFDMDILNAFFANKVKYLPGEYTVLNSDFRQSPTAPNKLFNSTSELKKHTKVVHFSCTPDGAYGKPWLWESHDVSFLKDEDVDPLFGELFEAYWRGEEAMCH